MMGLISPTNKMKKVTFESGKVRQICVSRAAIFENMRTGKNYPTVLVVDDGIPKEYHAVNTTGTLRFDATRNDLPAKVFIETDAEFDAFIDPEAEPTYLSLPRKPFFLVRWMSNLKAVFLGLPIVSCFVPQRPEQTNLRRESFRDRC